MFLELGIFISQFIWIWRVRHVRRAAKKAGMTYDQYVAENPAKKLERSESTETVDVEAGPEERKEGVVIAPLEKCVVKMKNITNDQTSNVQQYPEKAKPAGQA
jgi:hypothetical protein